MDSKICRICLNKTATIYLFSKRGDIQYSTKLMRCVNIVIEEGDGYPNAICLICAEELCATYEFVNKCEASEKILRCTDLSDLYNDIITKEEPLIKLEELPQEHNDYFDHSFIENHNDLCDTYNPKKSKKKYKNTENFKLKIDKRKLRPKLGPIRCVICGHIAASRSAMEGHMRTHTGEKPFTCQYCDSKFNLKGSLKRHVATHRTERERQFICETCGNSFLTKSAIITHMRVHTDERPFKCPFCLKAFRQIASMIRHKRMHTGERPYSCPVCFKKFTDKSHMIRHQAVHSSEKNYTCHLCNKSVKTKNALITHIKSHSNEKHNICNYCGMTFSLKGNLQSHIRRMHSEKSGECNICLKSFPDLQSHMRQHTGEKPFVCKLCDQAFSHKRSLSSHIGFKHDNASKYKCSIGECTKTFPTAKMLEFHLLKYHTNRTPYICHHCARGFFRTSDLSRHLKVSHMDMVKTLDSTLPNE